MPVIVSTGNKACVKTLRPSDISGLQYWYAADLLTGLNDADPISTITDQSSNARNLTQTLTARATYKTNIQNGKPGILFDGVNNTYQLSFTLNQNLTIICLFKLVVSTIAARIYDGGGVLDACNLQVSGINNTQLGTRAGTAFLWTPATSMTSIQQTSIICRTTTSVVYDNQSKVQFPIPIGSSNPGGVTLGSAQNSSQFGNFYLFEIMCFSSALSDYSRINMEEYLRLKWGL